MKRLVISLLKTIAPIALFILAINFLPSSKNQEGVTENPSSSGEKTEELTPLQQIEKLNNRNNPNWVPSWEKKKNEDNSTEERTEHEFNELLKSLINLDVLSRTFGTAASTESVKSDIEENSDHMQKLENWLHRELATVGYNDLKKRFQKATQEIQRQNSDQANPDFIKKLKDEYNLGF